VGVDLAMMTMIKYLFSWQATICFFIAAVVAYATVYCLISTYWEDYAKICNVLFLIGTVFLLLSIANAFGIVVKQFILKQVLNRRNNKHAK
jgi:hypothetical protein